jgi:CRP-like cAMP-binding protein
MSQLGAGIAARAAITLSHDPGRAGEEWADVLADVPLFRNVSRRHVKRVASLGRLRRYGPGTSIVRAGDAGSAFFVLLDGTARVVTAKGRPRRLRSGDFFGEMALLDGAPRTATVEAATEVEVMLIPRTAFRKMLRSEPAIAIKMLETVATRLRTTQASPTS